MYLTRLTLTNFRNYGHLELDLTPGVTVVQGGNACGKTSLLEAIFYLATAHSSRAGAERELIRWGASDEPIPFARAEAEVEKNNGTRTQLEIVLVQPNETAPQVNGARPANGRVTKRIKVNGVGKRALDLLGELNVVLFLPEDLDLVFGSPGDRRRYLDVTLAQIDPRYGRALSKYNQVLEQRNGLLREFRERGTHHLAQLAVWDQQLVAEGTYLIARRGETLMRYNHLVTTIHPRLTDAREELQLVYQPSVTAHPSSATTTGKELRVAGITRAFHEQLALVRPRELASAQTLVGPHRDDVRFMIRRAPDATPMDANTFASRGQGRTIALSLKLAEVALMRAETGETPVLLLDDVMSELDPARRTALAETVLDASQALITTTDLGDLAPEWIERVRVLHVCDGKIEM